MSFELDHFSVLTEPGAPAADRLIDLGMVEGTSNRHQGQGTANRRFFFSDAMLELLYVENGKEAQEGPAGGLGTVQRLAEARASPFGLVFKEREDSDAAPFSGWRYFPDYFNGDQCLVVGNNSDLLEEPLCVLMPKGLPAYTGKTCSNTPFTRVTAVSISLPLREVSPTLEAIATSGRVSLNLNKPHLMEVVFNEATERQTSDLRPSLPLLIRW